MTQNIQGIAKEGSLEPDRENDLLTKALGNKEHPGRTRGIESKVGWKHGFPNDAGQYKTRTRYKKNLEDQIQEQVKVEFMKMWNEKEKERAVLMSIEQPTSPSFGAASGACRPITRDILWMISQRLPPACYMFQSARETSLSRLPRARPFQAVCFTIETFRPVTPRYKWTRYKPLFMKYKLDISTPEGIELLDEAVGNFILWPKRDIIFSHQ